MGLETKMISIIENFWLDSLIGITVLSFIFYKFWTKNYAYWKERNIPYLEPTFPYGNSKDMVLSRRFLGYVFKDFYFQLKGHKYGGIITLRRPHLLLRDPEIIKNILTKDFNFFINRGRTIDEEKDFLLAHLFNLNGHRWKGLRTKLSPTFTSGKMKMMFNLVKACGQTLQNSFQEHADRENVVELKDYMARFGTDVIGSCAFGLEIDSINDPDSEFRRVCKNLFTPRFSVIIRNNINSIIPGLSKIIRMKTSTKERDEFFLRIVSETVQYREKHNIKRNDFLDLLIQIKNKGYVDDDSGNGKATGLKNQVQNEHSENTSSNHIYLTKESMTAQCFVFFIAGFETSSTTLSFCLYELALNKSIQQKLQQEIDTVLASHNEQISYEAIKEMVYMDRVVQETLRKYPPLGVLTRECTADYKFPDSELLLKKGMRVAIPLYGIHYDPEYYPEPERFDPDRFTEEAKQLRPNYTWLPFGEGPRICIGMRFGLMQVKTGLATLLSKYNFDRTKETQVPVKLSTSFLTASEHGILLKITNRT